MQSFMKDSSSQSLMSETPGFTRNANSDSSFRRTSSRYALHNSLCVFRWTLAVVIGSRRLTPCCMLLRQPVIEEDQLTANGESSVQYGGRRRGSSGQRKKCTPWYTRVQQIALLGLVALILRWRRGVTSAREKKLLMYLVASIGIAWSVRKLRSKSQS